MQLHYECHELEDMMINSTVHHNRVYIIFIFVLGVFGHTNMSLVKVSKSLLAHDQRFCWSMDSNKIALDLFFRLLKLPYYRQLGVDNIQPFSIQTSSIF